MLFPEANVPDGILCFYWGQRSRWHGCVLLHFFVKDNVVFHPSYIFLMVLCIISVIIEVEGERSRSHNCALPSLLCLKGNVVFHQSEVNIFYGTCIISCYYRGQMSRLHGIIKWTFLTRLTIQVKECCLSNDCFCKFWHIFASDISLPFHIIILM